MPGVGCSSCLGLSAPETAGAGSAFVASTVAGALAPQERTQVLATLLEEGRYLCSIRTMYRVLHDADEVTERRPQRRHPLRVPPRLVATAPKQVWTWDITRLPGPRKWVTYALYVVLDLFSRYVVAWMVATRESATRAQRLVSASSSYFCSRIS